MTIKSGHFKKETKSNKIYLTLANRVKIFLYDIVKYRLFDLGHWRYFLKELYFLQRSISTNLTTLID